MVNLLWLSQNATPLVINNSVLGNVNSVSGNLITNANTVSLGFFGLGVMISIFLYLIIRTTSPGGSVRMDLSRAIMFSSGFTFIIGFLMNLSGLVSSYNHALWFFTIFVISLLWVYYLKRNNQ